MPKGCFLLDWSRLVAVCVWVFFGLARSFSAVLQRLSESLLLADACLQQLVELREAQLKLKLVDEVAGNCIFSSVEVSYWFVERIDSQFPADDGPDDAAFIQLTCL